MTVSVESLYCVWNLRMKSLSQTMNEQTCINKTYSLRSIVSSGKEQSWSKTVGMSATRDKPSDRDGCKERPTLQEIKNACDSVVSLFER